MKRIHIVGRKNSGKTTLVVQLVEYLTAQGIRVGTVKHTHHRHELDTPGKDSHRHRQAGAVVVGILSPELNAVFLPTERRHDAPDRYESIAPLFQDCQVVIVEGHLSADAPKVEVWRAALEQPPLMSADSSILAVVTDDPVDANLPVLPRSNLAELAAALLDLAAQRYDSTGGRPA